MEVYRIWPMMPTYLSMLLIRDLIGCTNWVMLTGIDTMEKLPGCIR